MSLYNYFTCPGSVLPKLDSSLSTVVLASAIVAANEVVKKVISTDAGEVNMVISNAIVYGSHVVRTSYLP